VRKAIQVVLLQDHWGDSGIPTSIARSSRRSRPS
jgi:hypothetical protein